MSYSSPNPTSFYSDTTGAHDSNISELLGSLTTVEQLLLLGLGRDATAEDVWGAFEKFINENNIPTPTPSHPHPPDYDALLNTATKLHATMKNVHDDAVNQLSDQTDAQAEDTSMMHRLPSGQAGSAAIRQSLQEEYALQADALPERFYTKRLGVTSVVEQPGTQEHSVVQREKLNVGENTVIPIAQGVKNPMLRNTLNQQVTIDSSNRQTVMVSGDTPEEGVTATMNPNGIASPTNYLMNFSNPLTNVLSYQLTSVSIPYTFYNIDASLGNNYMYVDDVSNPICISGGNYTSAELIDTVSGALSGYTMGAAYNHIDHTVTIYNDGGTERHLIFYDISGVFTGCDTICGAPRTADGNLGFLLGYRSNVTLAEPVSSVEIPASSSLKAPAALKINSSRYFVLVIDDFNYNYINETQVIQNDMRPLVQTAFIPGDLSYICLEGISTVRVTAPHYSSSAPRKITNATLYALNQNASQKLGYNVRTNSANVPNAFATLPFSTLGMAMGEDIPIVDGISEASRTFFGPTTIDKMRVKLIDAIGNTVNLHGNDWFFNLSVTRLYQY